MRGFGADGPAARLAARAASMAATGSAAPTRSAAGTPVAGAAPPFLERDRPDRAGALATKTGSSVTIRFISSMVSAAASSRRRIS